MLWKAHAYNMEKGSKTYFVKQVHFRKLMLVEQTHIQSYFF